MAQAVIGALRANLGLDSAQFVSGARRALTVSQRLGRSLRRIGAGVSVFGTGMALALRGQLSAIDEVGKRAQVIGIPVEELSKLNHAAELSGVSLTDLEAGVGRLSRTMSDNAEKFAELGISVRDSNGDMRSTVDVLRDVSGVLENMPDGAEKTALAMDLMGRSGARMIPLLNGGADAFDAMMREAESLGLVISQGTYEAAAQFNDNLTRLGRSVTGLARVMAAQLAPILARITDFIVAATNKFGALSPEVQKFIGVAGGIAVVLGPALIALGLFVSAIGAISSPVLAVIAVLSTLTAGVVAFWPHIVAAKDALVGFARDGVDWARGRVEVFGAVIGSLGETMSNAVGSAIDWLNQKWDLFIEKINRIIEKVREFRDGLREVATGIVGGPLGGVDESGLPGVRVPNPWDDDYVPPGSGVGAGREIGRNISQGIATGIVENRPSVDAALATVPESAREMYEIHSPSRLFARIGKFLSQGLGQGIREGAPEVEGAMGEVAERAVGATERLSDAGNGLRDSFAGAFAKFVDGARAGMDAVSNLLKQLAAMAANAAFKQLFGGIFGGGFGRGMASFFGFGGYANGTMSAARGLAWVGEKGPELVNFKGGERVYTAAQSKKMSEGAAMAGPQNIDLHAPISVNLDSSLFSGMMLDPANQSAVIDVVRRSGLVG